MARYPSNHGRDSPGQDGGGGGANQNNGNAPDSVPNGYSAYSAEQSSLSAADTASQLSTTLDFASTTATLNNVLPSTTTGDGASVTSADAAVTSTGTAASTSSTDPEGTDTSADPAIVNSFTSAQTTFEISTTPAFAAITSTPSSLQGSEHSYHHDSVSSGTLVPAILVPTLIALLLLALAFYCLRKRSRDSRRRAASFFPAMREKFGGARTSIMPLSPPNAASSSAPVVTSETNNAYFTGLDTSSHGSQREQSGEYYAPARRSEGGTFMDPPPPYKAKSAKSRESLRSSHNHHPLHIPPVAVVPEIREPENNDPFTDPFPSPTIPTAPTSAAGGLLADSVDRPAASRGTTSDSFTSTLYSDTASVHSARAERMSVAGTQLLRPTTREGRVGSTGIASDPFGDPESPVGRFNPSTMTAEEWHNLRSPVEDGPPSS